MSQLFWCIKVATQPVLSSTIPSTSTDSTADQGSKSRCVDSMLIFWLLLLETTSGSIECSNTRPCLSRALFTTSKSTSKPVTLNQLYKQTTSASLSSTSLTISHLPSTSMTPYPHWRYRLMETTPGMTANGSKDMLSTITIPVTSAITPSQNLRSSSENTLITSTSSRSGEMTLSRPCSEASVCMRTCFCSDTTAQCDRSSTCPIRSCCKHASRWPHSRLKNSWSQPASSSEKELTSTWLRYNRSNLSP